MNIVCAAMKRLALCFLLLLLVTGSHEAHAVAVVNPGQTAAELSGANVSDSLSSDIIEKLIEINQKLEITYQNFDQGFKKFRVALYSMAKGMLAARKMLNDFMIKASQAEEDALTKNLRLRALTRAATRYALPKDEYLCKAIVSHESVVTTEDFERETSRMMAEAVANRYRCPTCDGSGPDYVGKETALRKKSGFVNTGIDGIKSDATTQVKGSYGQSLADADISPVDKRQIYEMPPIVSRSYEDPVSGVAFAVNTPAPDVNNARQMFWMAAWNNLFIKAGPRPTPAHGKAKDRPVGKTQRAMFHHCAASEAALVKQCSDLVAFYTRPNCTKNADLCASQNEKCLAAQGVVNIEQFDSCANGLSPYEEQKIAQSMCKADQHFVSGKGAGQTDARLTVTTKLCDMSYKTWEAFVREKESNCSKAGEAMQELRGCWASVEVLGAGGSASYEGEMAKEYLASHPSGQEEHEAMSVQKVDVQKPLPRLHVQKISLSQESRDMRQTEH